MRIPLRKTAIIVSSFMVVAITFFQFNTLVDFASSLLPGNMGLKNFLSQDVSAANVCVATTNDTIPVWYQDAADGNKMKLRDSTMSHTESLGRLTLVGTEGIRMSSTANDYGFINSRGAIHISQNAYYNGSAWNFIDVNSFTGQAATIQTNVGGSEAFRVSSDIDGATGGLAMTTRFVVRTSGRVGIGANNTNPTGMLDLNSSGTTTWGSWNNAINFSNGSHNAIVNPAGELLFGMHSDNNFYWADTSGANAGYKMTLNAGSGNLDITGAFTMDGNTVIDDGGGWVRTRGDSGWYNQTYSGGWYMTDTTWLRAYNGKSVISSGTIRADGDMRAPIYYDQNSTSFYMDPDSNSMVRYSFYQNDSSATAHNIIGRGDQWGVGTAKGLMQYYSNYVWPGRVDASAWNTSWYLGSHGSYGLYTNTGFYVSGPVYAPYLYDINDGNYIADPNSVSHFNDLRLNIMYDRANTGYYVDPASNSVVNKFNAGAYGSGAGNFNAYSLEVGGSSNATNGNATIFFHHHGVSAHQIRYSAHVFYFERAGNGYGTSNTPSIWVGGSVNANQASDARYKKNVKPISNALETLNKLNAITYQWTDPTEMGIQEEPNKTHMGFIAQEVQKIFPDWIYINEDGKYFIKDNVDTKLGFQALIVQAIKEFQEQFEAFKTDVTSQLNKLNQKQTEQQKLIESQQKLVEAQQKQIEILEKRVEALEKK